MVTVRKDGFSIDLLEDSLTLAETSSQSYSDTSTPRSSTQNTELARRLAGILLDTRKLVRNDFHVVQPLEVANDTPADFQVSKTTLARAKKVQTAFALKYTYIERIYHWANINVESNDHAGIEGVYNPLQVIRNRKIRQKYHEFPKPLATKTLPLPCNVFSSKNTNPKRPWKLLWSVELSEYFYDTMWRNAHWHELVRPDGRLWFPELAPANEKKLRKRLHDKLFREENDSGSESSTLSRRSSDADTHTFHINILRRHIRKHVKSRAKKRYPSSSPWSSEDESDFSTSDEKITEHADSEESLLNSNSPHQPPVPALRVDGANSDTSVKLAAGNVPKTQSDTNLKTIAFKPIDKSSSSDVAEQDFEVDDMYAKHLHGSIDYVNSIVYLKLNYLANVYPELHDSVNSRLDNILGKQVELVLKTTVEVNDHILPAYEMLYHGFLDEIKSLIHMVNENYAVRIDNLLGASDRSIGEINTSLSLELRKVNERLDKLNSSLFSNIVTGAITESDLTVNMSDSGHYSILYVILENAIVIVLRLVWVVVNIYKFFMAILRFFWRVITFIF